MFSASSVYFHIPFCRHACSYCDFYFLVTKKKEEVFFKALKKEFVFYTKQGRVDFKNLKSIYFGGGTPSFVNPKYIEEILNLIFTIGRKTYSSFKLNELEITLEANPEDLIEGRLAEYNKMGVNRISLGVQSFRSIDLNYLGRVEPSRIFRPIEQVLEEIQGWKYWSLDLIYGMPTLSHEEWAEQIDKAIFYRPPHLSLYSLTVEEGTPLAYKIQNHNKSAPVDNQVSEQFVYASKQLEKVGYEHYEVSNYALNGAYSIHNSGYWSGEPYLGLGPAAHSYDGVCRYKNFSNLNKYINYLQSNLGKLPIEESERLSTTAQFNEILMVALRRNIGCDLLVLEKKFGVTRVQDLLDRAKTYMESGSLYVENHQLIASLDGKNFLDRITSDLFED